MEEISASPTSRVSWLTPGDRQSREQGSDPRPSKPKSVAGAREESAGVTESDIWELTAPGSQEKHQLDELA